ncbi:hypothetical protein [Abyssalbus ytuae]|uniref:Uncharacterized protein n=1 Tax=Abyssalbus ytuae TaxID=2926907 RepID=A0A9E6ZWD6_9FLAO|nr:hypothetical protein [Abyssalbus ytuae]UOB16432.1 hypothetical protein MQE35_11865 [Abyssalbus ytuae]
MNNVLSLIGVIVLVGSVPLTIYLYLKYKEKLLDITKKDIVEILSTQIGERGGCNMFEIQTIINSKTRENKLDPRKIKLNEIIEDLVVYIIVNHPPGGNTTKEEILHELKNIYLKQNEILGAIDKVEKHMQDETPDTVTDKKVEGEIRRMIEKKREQIISDMQSDSKKTSALFGFLAIIVILVGSVLIMIIKKEEDKYLAEHIIDFLSEHTTYIFIFIGALSLLITYFIVVSRLKK